MKIIVDRGLYPDKFYPIPNNEKINDAASVLMYYGLKPINPLDIENINYYIKSGSLRGPEVNRLFSLNDRLYVFDRWDGEYPFNGVIVERIGYIQ